MADGLMTDGWIGDVSSIDGTDVKKTMSEAETTMNKIKAELTAMLAIYSDDAIKAETYIHDTKLNFIKEVATQQETNATYLDNLLNKLLTRRANAENEADFSRHLQRIQDETTILNLEIENIAEAADATDKAERARKIKKLTLINEISKKQRELDEADADYADKLDQELYLRKVDRLVALKNARDKNNLDEDDWNNDKSGIMSSAHNTAFEDARAKILDATKTKAITADSFSSSEGIASVVKTQAAGAMATSTKLYQDFSDEQLEIIKARLDIEGKLYDQHGNIIEANLKKAIEDNADMFDPNGEAFKKREKKAAKERQIERRETHQENTASAWNAAWGKDSSWNDRIKAFKELGKDETGAYSKKTLAANLVKGAANAGLNALGNFAQKLDATIDEIGKYRAPIDTRLYGAKVGYSDLTSSVVSIAGLSPYMLQTDMYESLVKLVDAGISQNIELKAFLDSTANKIATTFEVSDATLLKLIRIQQADTTAARMGMEASLNALLNEMYETTEYLSGLADTVRANLYEAQSLMGAVDATEFEYQVQKWMGSMYSVGMSDEAVSSISTALGQLAAGQIEALTGEGTSNLMVMAANRAGLPIGDILKDGLDSDETNRLLQATVEYLAEIAESSDSKVVQQQLAGIFGIKASDLKAAMNLSSSTKKLSSNELNYAGMLGELESRYATMGSRVDLGQKMKNLWTNIQYTMATGIATNPAMLALYKVAGLIQDTTGGINLPTIMGYGTGIGLNTTVAQLMQVTAMIGGMVPMIGDIASALGNAGSGAAMLNAAGFASASAVVSRGTGAKPKAGSGASTSSSGGIGNSSSGDPISATLAQAADDAKDKLTSKLEDPDDASLAEIIEAIKLQTIEINALQLKGIDVIREESAKNRGDASFAAGSTGGWTNASTSRMQNA
jgi:hypothetical protein